MKQKIGIITTRHNRYDIRIFEKQVKELSKHFDVLFFVRDGIGNNSIDNIKIIDVSIKDKVRFKVFREYFKIIKIIIREKLNSIHFHDPDFLLLLPFLKFKKQIKVYYDIHEDLPRQILTKPYIKFPKITSSIAEILEILIVKFFVDKTYCATPKIQKRFEFKQSVIIANYPIIDYVTSFRNTERNRLKKNKLIYFGSISKTRGLDLILTIAGADYIDKIILIGKFETASDHERATNHKNWDKIDYYQPTTQEKVFELSKQAIAGICLLYPTRNYIDSLPVKLFEYMALGLPVVYSNFTYWKSLFPNEDIGLACDPLKKDILITEIGTWIANREKLNIIGQKNISLVKQNYSWESEAQKLLESYGELYKR